MLHGGSGMVHCRERVAGLKKRIPTFEVITGLVMNNCLLP